MEQRYEYVAVEVPKRTSKADRLDDAITHQLNAVAEHGYRVVAVIPGGQYGGGHVVLEREVSDE